MLSKTSIKLLNNNGYKVEQNKDSIFIKQSDSDRYAVGCVGVLLVLSSLVIMLLSFVFGVLNPDWLDFDSLEVTKQGRWQIFLNAQLDRAKV